MNSIDRVTAIVAAQIRAAGMAAENAASAGQPVCFGLAAFEEVARSIEGPLLINVEASDRLAQIRGILEGIAARGKHGGRPVEAAELKAIWELAGGESGD